MRTIGTTPGAKGFAFKRTFCRRHDLMTTNDGALLNSWERRLTEAPWSGREELNLHIQLGKLPLCR
jgi:hypothetical protein